MNSTGNPIISVIIPVLNMADKLENCLQAVFSQTIVPHEVIIIDGQSTDGTVDIAKKFDVKVINQDYGWAAAARQLGLEAAGGQYVAFTDGDCIPPENWLEGLLAEFEDGVVGVGGGVKNVGEGLWIQSINHVLGTLLGGGNSAQGRDIKNKRYEKDINAFNCIYLKDALIEAGGFNIHLSGADEAELGRRVIKVGRLLYTPNVVVVHDHKRGLAKFARQMFNYGRWRRECRVWSLPVIPPLVAPLILIMLALIPWVSSMFIVPSALAALYLAIVFITGVAVSISERNWRYLFSIPIVYMIQHSLFTLGFWRELILPRKKGKT
ncbi:MAG: glycosyltransferase [Chloroflexi bacterium]|jgi:glycosyltransferase involved in cell wall biosynthesis|nr:glycosyltransferase [Chloroflexota bacterium]MBT7289867.1 glycosyltransferase [Chloroflexota bacterium]